VTAFASSAAWIFATSPAPGPSPGWPTSECCDEKQLAVAAHDTKLRQNFVAPQEPG
jgi:hypothetical protein